MSRERYDVVVIGAGGGGLAAASRLAQAGLKTLVIEQHNKIGGYMTSFQRGPYTFEVSLHNFDGLDPNIGMNYTVFKQLGIIDRINSIRLEPAFNAVYPGRFFSIPADPVLYQDYLIQQFPHEERGIRKFFRTMEGMKTALMLMRNHQERNYRGMVRSLLRHPLWILPFVRYSHGTARQFLDDHFGDEKLKTLVAWLACYGGATQHKTAAVVLMGMIAAYHYGGFYYFEGGSQSVSNALGEVITENGGQILLSSLATEIVIRGGLVKAVKTQDGSEYPCRYVVSNSNAPATINKMAGREHFSRKFLKKMDALDIGPTCACVYLGVAKDYRKVFKGAHTIVTSERWTVPENFDLMADGDPHTTDMILANYSAVDSTCAPAGKNVIVLVGALPYDFEKGWNKEQSTKEYEKLKQEVAEILIHRAEAHLPELSEHIEKMEVATPHTMERYTLNPKGSIIGWGLTMNPLEVLNRLPSQTPVRNLFLAGAWQSVGGQSPVLASGLRTANKILKLERKPS
jgi:prolycopene isomerase